MSKNYELIQFSFSKPSGRRNGKSYAVTAFLLIPEEELAAFQQWSADVAAGVSDGILSGDAMYCHLLSNGALPHREDGPAYKEVEKSAFDRNHAKVVKEEYWNKGVRQSGPPPKSYGRYKF